MSDFCVTRALIVHLRVSYYRVHNSSLVLIRAETLDREDGAHVAAGTARGGCRARVGCASAAGGAVRDGGSLRRGRRDTCTSGALVDINRVTDLLAGPVLALEGEDDDEPARSAYAMGDVTHLRF